MDARQRSAVDRYLAGDAVAVGPRVLERGGLCSQTDPDLFHPEKGEPAKPARRTCAGCDVQQECLEYALVKREANGIWGGMTPGERARVQRDRRRIVAGK